MIIEIHEKACVVLGCIEQQIPKGRPKIDCNFVIRPVLTCAAEKISKTVEA